MIPDRIAKRISPVPFAGCWLWVGSGLRYGTVYWEGRIQRAHRVVFQLCGHELPPGMELMHSCDNGFCVNPAHLSVGTHQDNMNDMVRKGRARAPTGDAHWTRHDKERARQIGRKNILATHASGFANTNAKVTPEVIAAVRQTHRCDPNLTLTELGAPHGIGRETARKIVKGIAPWKL